MRGQGIAVALFLLLLPETLAMSTPECPRGRDCTDCDSRPELQNRIFCGKETSSLPMDDLNFVVEYFRKYYNNKSYWVVEINCYGAPNWSDFYLGTEKKLKYMSEIIFQSCNLPEDRQLISIVNQLLGTNVSDSRSDGSLWNGTISLRFNSNKNLTIASTSFEGFDGYKEIDISNNKLGNVPEDLFRGFNSLTTLILDKNKLETISAKFLNFPKLIKLSIKRNKLQIIENTTFTNLPMLQKLNLFGNQIRKIDGNSFDNNPHLIELILERNIIKILSPYLFNSLQHLDTLSIAENSLSVDSLLSGLFLKNTKLVQLKLSHNKVSNRHLSNDIFISQSNLYELYLDDIGLVALTDGLLRNLGELSYLTLAENYLTTIPDLIFKGCRKLSILNLKENQLVHISVNMFSGLEGLKCLIMPSNKIQYIDINAFRSMPQLREAHLYRNRITFNNTISTSDEQGILTIVSPFYHIRNSIEELDLDENNISGIYDDWLSAPKLQKLSLANNLLTHLSYSDIRFTSNYAITVDLRFNKIRSFDLRKFDAMKSSRAHTVVELLLDKNPFECDCSIYHFLRYHRNKTSITSQQLFRIPIDDLACAGPLELRGTLVKNLDEKSLLCAVPSTCPVACDCSFRAWDQALVINCSHRGLTEVPAALDLGSNGPVELNLTGNFVKSVPTLSQLGYYNLTVLSLSDNKISSLSLRNLSDNLTGLFLHGNNLTQLSEEDILFLANSTKLKNLTLHDNPWMCNCDTLNFLDFIQTKQSRFIELQLVTCNSMDTPVFNMTRDDVCPASVAPIIGGSVAFVLLLIVVISTAVYYRYEDGIKVWLFAHRLLPWLVNEAELDRDKIYDAFISYSHQDEDFVANTLVPKLEEGPRAFKLCVHYRDWLAGEFITEQIARSVADSRRTIVVLSRNFLASEWGRMEFRTAHCAALSEGRTRVIVIIYGDIGPIDKLDPELASYMRTNTYIKWGDKWFWEKLRYALPHLVDD